MQPVIAKRVPLALQRLLTSRELLDVWTPFLNFALQVLDEGDEGHCLRGRASLDGKGLEIRSGFEYGGICILYRRTESPTVVSQELALPRIVLRIDFALRVGVIDSADPKLLLHFSSIEGTSGLSDIRQKFAPVRKGIPETLRESARALGIR